MTLVSHHTSPQTSVRSKRTRMHPSAGDWCASHLLRSSNNLALAVFLLACMIWSQMRIERQSQVSALKPRLERFFIEALSGRDLDMIQHPESRKADFVCLRGLLAIELKCLEEDGSNRIENLADELRVRADWPPFFGKVGFEAILKNLDDPELVRRRVVDRIGRAIKNHVQKANKQLAAHETAFPRKNAVKVMVLANENHDLYDPETVSYILDKLLHQLEGDALRYAHIDAVLYLTERHVANAGEQVAFPVICLEGSSVDISPWKRQILDLLVCRWARWNAAQMINGEADQLVFTTIEDVPDKMRRHDLWELEYRRRPYMTGLTNEQVRERFDEAVCTATLVFHKNSPFKPDHAAIKWSMETMSHLIVEMGNRALPLTQFPFESLRLSAAAKRLHLPPNAISWFDANLGRSDPK